MVISMAIRTSSAPFSETKGGVSVQFNGTSGLSSWNLLKYGFQQGASDSFVLEVIDIGLIQGVNFKIDSSDGWLLDSFDLYSNFKSLTDIDVNKWLKVGDIKEIRAPRTFFFLFFLFFFFFFPFLFFFFFFLIYCFTFENNF